MSTWTRFRDRIAQKVLRWLGYEPKAAEPAAEPAPAEQPAGTEPGRQDSAAGGSLVFKFGGFDGSKAVEDPHTQIKSGRFDRNGMSYKWDKGDLSNWGLNRTTAGALACAFYWCPSKNAWIGGKFDWISTSRTTRDWENIRGHYNGWDADAFFAASRHAFCIVSKDGRRRTNLEELA